jgi:hypothetical protein
MGGKAARQSADDRWRYPFPVMALSPEDRRDRAKVNEAVRRYRESQERT